jgi:hypothetical protein
MTNSDDPKVTPIDRAASAPEPPGDLAAARVLAKLREFVAGLDDEERAVMAALLAPAVASAYDESERAGSQDVVGFGMSSWSPEDLPDSLSARIRAERLRIEFDDRA